jgi:Flp pilus assembly protein CpaB
MVGVVAVIGVLAYRQIIRFTQTRVPVWVSAGALRAGHVVGRADLRQMEMTTVPARTLASRTDIEGRKLLANKLSGEPFVASDLAPRPTPTPLAETIPPGRLLATVAINAMDMPAAQLAAGDRVDIVLATPEGVHMVVKDAHVMGTLTRPQARPAGDSGEILGVDISIPTAGSAAPAGMSLVLAVYPLDVYPLAAAEASGRKMKVVLQPAAAVRAGQLLDIRPPMPPPRRVAPAPKPSRPPEPARVELIVGGRVQQVALP